MSTFEESVHEAVARLSPGEIVSYGDIAVEVGRPGAARAVGAVLARSDGSIPWWRVVAANGRLVPGHEAEHARRLASEGVALTPSGRVRIARSRRGCIEVPTSPLAPIASSRPGPAATVEREE